MGIKCFSNIINENLKKISLNDSTVVIDAKNFWYNMYEYFKIPFAFGCESDIFAKHVKEYLMLFKKANIQCYFVFKGGTSDIEKFFQKRQCQKKLCENYTPGRNNYIHPLYADNIITEVLTEIGYKYVFCEYEAKNTCIFLAQKLSCPVVSYDNEFSMSNIDYVPHNLKYTQKLVERKGKMECGVFNLKDFLEKNRISINVFILFVVLTDESIFPQNYFRHFLEMIGSPSNHYQRNKYLLKWLSINGIRLAVHQLLNLNVNKKQLFDAIASVTALLNRKEDGGLPLHYILGNVEIDELDHRWFEKGITLQHIDKSYVDLYRSKIIHASNVIQDSTQANAIIFSSQIIKYAYDLLTDFKGGEITIKFLNNGKPPLKIALSTRRPNYDCHTCVFENGWENIKPLNLFQHFISETLESFDFTMLENAPEDAKLLIIALVYFSRQKGIDTSNETLSILMSYVMLNVVSTHIKDVYETTERRTLNTTLDDNPLLLSDCIRAVECLKSHFATSNIAQLFDFKILHPLSEFQHCLHELNKLNNLCGKPYKPTLYSKTYNGTFVYNFLLYVKDNNGIKGINNVLHQSVTVLAYFNRLRHIFIKIEYI